MKSHENTMFGMYSSILKDIQNTYPSMRVEIELNRSRLSRQLAARGSSYFTITLPAACDWFHQALEHGQLPEGPRPICHKPKSSKDTRPTFMWGLYSELFDEHGTLRDVPDPTPVFFLRQIYLFAKKFNMECTQEKVDETIQGFIDVEDSLPRSHPDTWDCDSPKWSPRYGHPIWGFFNGGSDHELIARDPPLDNFDWRIFRNLVRECSASLGYLDIWSLRPKHGPGVVSDGKDVKYNFTNWPKKLGKVFPPDWFASTDLVDRTRTDREFPSRLACVPKTQKGPRLIAAEPTAHQWIQGGIQRWFEDAIRRHPLGLSIDFSNQEYSMQMALTASRHKAFATVDLSAASDRLTTRLVEYVFQSNYSILDALHASRSRALKIPSGISNKPERLLLLKKFAPMGSACTFPVQTIVFTLLAHFAIMVTEGDSDTSVEALRRRAPKVRVFGDDIIVPTDVYPVLERILESVLLRVNSRKSFHKGFFRESCGMDAYRGFDVTPAYLRSEYDARDPATLASVLECSNNFYKKGLWHSADYLLKTVPVAERKLIPVSSKVVGPCSLFTYQQVTHALMKRMNPYLHVEEILVLEISAINKKREGTGEASLLQYFTEAPSPSSFVKWEHGEAVRPSLRKKRRWVTL